MKVCYFLVLSASRPQITSLRSTQACCYTAIFKTACLLEALFGSHRKSLSGKDFHFFPLAAVKYVFGSIKYDMVSQDPGTASVGVVYFCCRGQRTGEMHNPGFPIHPKSPAGVCHLPPQVAGTDPQSGSWAAPEVHSAVPWGNTGSLLLRAGT